MHLHQTLRTVLLLQTLQSYRQLASGETGVSGQYHSPAGIPCYRCEEVGLPLSGGLLASAGLKLLWEL